MPLKPQPKEKFLPNALVPELIAPCGMNCGLCAAYIRSKNACPGCRAGDEGKPQSCVGCTIRTCAVLESSGSAFCSSDCEKYPCRRLKQLDVRYRAKYRMSMLDNLDSIADIGLDAFVASEQARWACPECGGLQCVHTPACIYCGHAWPSP